MVAEIYQMPVDDLKKFVTDLHFNPGQAGGDGWWSASPEEFSKLSSDLKKSGQTPLLRPRILTSSGKPADFFVGNGTNSTELDCLPVVEDGQVDLAIQGELVNQSAATAVTNRFKVNALMPNHGGMVLRIQNGASNAVVCLSVETLTNGPTGALVKPSEALVWSLTAENPANDPAARSQPWPMPARQTQPAAAALNPPVFTGPGRQAIMAKLDRIRLWNVSYDGVPLSEVLMQLTAQCKLMDPEHKGIKFLINNNPEISSLMIKTPSLTDVRLADVLDAIVRGTDRPIQYSVMDFDVVFSAKSPEPLFTRVFRMNTNVFLVDTNSIGRSLDLVRTKCIEAAVDWQSPPGKSCFGNGLGYVFVKATKSDMDLIEKILGELNQAPLPTSLEAPRPAVKNSNSTGILTNPNFEAALRALPTRTVMGDLGEPTSPTTSGRGENTAGIYPGRTISVNQTNPPAVPAEYAHTPPVYTGPGRQAIMAKLGNIHLGNVSYDGLPLSEVLRQLSAQCKLLDPAHKGINFLINNNPDRSGQPVAAGSGAVSAPNLDPSTGLPLAPTAGTGVASDDALDIGSVIIRIPSLTDVRVSDVLDAVVLTANHPIKYSIQDFAIIFSARSPATPPLAMRTFRVDPNTFDSGLDQVGAKSFGAVQNRGSTGGGGGAGQNQNNGAVVGVVNAFGTGGGSPGTSQEAGGSGRLDQAAPAAEPIQPGSQGQNRQASEDDLVRDGKVFYELGKYGQAKEKFKAALALNQNSARANYYLRLINEEEARLGRKEAQDVSGRQQIVSKLDHIRLASVSFDALNLNEVVRQLNEAAKQNDPEKVGVHLLIATNSVSSQWDEINSVIVKLSSLTEVRLADVLDAVIMVADRPIQYSIQDYGVVFSARGSEKPQLFMRTFRVDTNVLYSAVENARAQAGQTASAADTRSSVVATARNFFHQLGVDWNSPPGKQVYFNAQKSYLFVKATESDLDEIERALQLLNEAPPLVDPAPPQLHIKARFYEVPKGTMKDFEKYLNTTNPVDGQPMGILTSQKANAARQALQSLKNVEVLGEPEITMLSGRQAQMRATEMVSVVTNVVFDAVRTNQSGKVEYSGVTSQTEEAETGPVLDLVPYVLADGYTINLAAIPSVTEFVGFDWITNSAGAGYNYHYFSGNQPPKLQNTRYVATANLWDNQTLFLGEVQKRVLGRINGFPSVAEDKELLVFITATIIDPAGNRVHSDDELPFAQDATPAQPQGQVNIPSSLLNPPAHIITLQGRQTQMKASTTKTYIGDFPPYHNGDPIHKSLDEPGAGAWP